MFGHQLAQKRTIEAMQIVDGIDQAEARANAEKQRDLAEAALEVDDDRRALGEPREVHGAVDRNRGRARTALGAEKGERGGSGARPVGGFAAGGRSPNRAVEGFRVRRPGEELRRRPRASPAG